MDPSLFVIYHLWKCVRVVGKLSVDRLNINGAHILKDINFKYRELLNILIKIILYKILK